MAGGVGARPLPGDHVLCTPCQSLIEQMKSLGLLPTKDKNTVSRDTAMEDAKYLAERYRNGFLFSVFKQAEANLVSRHHSSLVDLRRSSIGCHLCSLLWAITGKGR